MKIFLLELKIFINIYQGVIYVYMVDFHIADHNIQSSSSYEIYLVDNFQ